MSERHSKKEKKLLPDKGFQEIGKLVHFLGPYRGIAAFSMAMLVAMVACDLAVPRLIARIIDKGIRQKDMAVVLTTSGIMLGISVVDALVAVLNSVSSIRVGESIARDLREAFFVKVQRFSYGNLDQYSTGKLMVRLTSDTAAVQRVFQISLRIGTRAPLTMIGSIVLMFVTSPTLALSMLPLLLVAGILIFNFSTRMEPFFRTVQQKLDRLNTVLQENIAGARLVKAFVRGSHEAERFGGANDDLTDGTVKVMQFMSSMGPALTLVVNVGMVAVIWLGGSQAIRGHLTLGQIIAFTNYLLATMLPLIQMTQLSNTWANGIASAKRINEVFDSKPEVAEAADAVGLPDKIRGEVRFEGVGFHYNGDSDQTVLADIELCAEPGKTLAILGATGSGKTSLLNLVPRFYDASTGGVLIDGSNVRGLREDSILRHIGIVPQETILFSGTVRDNIRYGHPDASDAEVETAAKIAQAHDFILSLPDGYGTHIEERGGNLSGGQKQRIAIARALVGKPSILLLDDSTSSVDVETETKIQDAIAKYSAGFTVIIVAQRISTVLNADKILVLDKGRIAAQGTHAELLASSDIYKEIFDSQLGGGIEGRGAYGL